MSQRSLHRRAPLLATLMALLAVLSSRLAWANDGPIVPPTRAEVVRVYYANLAQRNKLLLSFKAQVLETNYQQGYHVMQLTAQEIRGLARAGFQVQADPEWRPRSAPDRAAPSVQVSGISGYPCYRTVEESLAAVQQIAQDHPHLATWQDIGDSWEKTVGLGGYDLIVLRLTNRSTAGPKPVLLLNAALHAREYATAELVTRFAERLVADYGVDADVTWILDYHEVHAVLHANPDGRRRAEVGLPWRKNTNQAYCPQSSDLCGADLNRNFDFQWNCCNGSSDDQCAWDYHGPAAASEPETQALQNYMQAVLIDQRGPDLYDAAPEDASGLFVDVHSYGEQVLWPWGFTDGSAPNAAQLQTLGRKLAYWNHYTPMQAVGLYPIDGGSVDFAYGHLGVAAYTLELGTSFFEPCTAFEATILPDVLPSLLYAAKVARAPYLMPVGPDSLQLALSEQEVPAGTPIASQATIDDTRYEASNGSEPAQEIVAAEWYLNLPPWATGAEATAMAPSDGEWDSGIERVESTIDTTDWSPGRHTLFVRGQDADGNWGAPSALFVTISGDANEWRTYFPYVHISRPVR